MCAIRNPQSVLALLTAMLYAPGSPLLIWCPRLEVRRGQLRGSLCMSMDTRGLPLRKCVLLEFRGTPWTYWVDALGHYGIL